MGKMDFLKFHSDDVKAWLFRIKQFFSINGFVRTHGENVAWAEYKEAVLKRFEEANEDPMAELKNLRYKTTTKEYQNIRGEEEETFEECLEEDETGMIEYVLSKEVQRQYP
ncbi:hypothetical protein Tco_1491827 [Tanacetum coccineum]